MNTGTAEKLIISTLQSLPKGSPPSLAEAAVLFTCDRVDDVNVTFVPTRTGPRSHVVKRIADKLTERGLVSWGEEVSVQNIHIEVREQLSGTYRQAIDMLLKRLDRLGGEGFMNYMTNAYVSMYTQAGPHQAERRSDECDFTTLGYEGKSIDEFLSTLIRNSVDLLIDVRANAISRKYGFSKSRLKDACEQSRIEYVHFSRLGIDSSRRKAARESGDWDSLFTDYEQSLSEKQDLLREISSMILAGRKPCLTCFEHLACDCHRSKISSNLNQHYDLSYEDL